jgi:hypothetical protein
VPDNITFGDNVRVLRTPETERAGLAERLGCVYGATTPSVTNVEVIGHLSDDCAINVHFEDLNQAFWFAPDLLEFVDHAPGTEAWVQGSPTKSVRQPDGSWLEVPIDPPAPGRFQRFISRLLGRTPERSG